MKYLILFFMVTFLQASTLLTYNVYERSDRVDVMLSFDAPYEGKIFQQQEQGSVSLILGGLKYEKNVQENINSNILQDLFISPIENGTKVTINSNQHVGLFASKTLDGFGLRIRVKLIAPPMKDLSQTQNNSLSPTSNLLDNRYFTVIGVMLILILFLLFLKRRLAKKSIKTNMSLPFKQKAKDINIIAQKAVDLNNKVSLVEFNQNKYLILTGTSNVLLDKYSSDGVLAESKDDFELLFEENQKKLNQYLNAQIPNQLNSYKQKAAQDYGNY